MVDLRVDLDAVRELGRDLTTVANEFDNAGRNSARIADAVGHDGLAETVRSFASAWDDTRAKMAENLRGLGETATGIADAFTETDGELRRAVE